MTRASKMLAAGAGRQLWRSISSRAAIDVASQLDEARQVLQLLTDAEVVGVVEGGLGAEGAVELEVLLDVSVAMIDVQVGADVLGEDARACAGLTTTPAKAAVEEQRHVLGAAQVEM
jgi:hypothetical protein